MNHTVSIQKSALWQISIRWHRILFVLAKRIVNTSPTSSVISKLPYLWLTWDIHVHIMSLFISTIYNKISWDTLPQRTHLTFWWHQKAKKKTPPPHFLHAMLSRASHFMSKSTSLWALTVHMNLTLIFSICVCLVHRMTCQGSEKKWQGR